MRKRLVFAAIVTKWIVLPAFLTITYYVGMGIIGGICTWGAYTSYAMEKTMISLSVAVMYLLPLIMMLFFYSRIVYALKNKVRTTTML